MNEYILANNKKIKRLLYAVSLILFTAIIFYSINLYINNYDNIRVQAINWNFRVADNGTVTMGGEGLGYSSASQAWNALIDKFKFFVMGLTALGTVAMVLFFVWNFIKLGSTFDNEHARAGVISGLIWSAIASAGLGSVTFFVGMSLNLLK